ncbi:MAG: porin [Burkholderiaceae bacterium]|nr:porin [Burkholderiaceae bacterium]
MKYPFATLALLGAGLAHAQSNGTSNVTLYGTFDGGLRHLSNTDSNGNSKLTVGSNGVYLANRLGFSGTEDLGGGASARFVLESGFNTGTGALDNAAGTLFNRSAWVGIGGKWGNLAVGRQYTVGFAIAKDYEPFTYRYISLIPVGGGAGTTLPAAATAAGLGASATSGTRFNNDIQYSGTFGPITAMAEYAAGEQAGNSRNGAAQAVGLKYNSGRFNLGAAYTQKKTAAGFDNQSTTIGGGYQFGDIKLKLGYAQERQDSALAGTYRNTVSWGGVTWTPAPLVEIIGAWYHTQYRASTSGKRDFYIVSATYALSKRTRLYTDIDQNRYTGALLPATRQSGQTGISAGINHAF